MSNPKFTLERYKPGGRNRYTCPQCGKHKCFTRYVNTETGEYIDDSCGKCDHELSCGYHLKPREYFAEHPVDREHDMIMKKEIKSMNPIKTDTKRSLGTIDYSYVEKSHSKASAFVKWMERAFGSSEQLQRVFDEYMLGATRDGGVIYWQIDFHGKVRAGKVMHYWANGHRVADEEDFAKYRGVKLEVHSPKPTYYLHSKMMHSGQLPKDWTLSQCLFGEHLLAKRKDNVVCLVESEKSAIVCSIFYPQYVWLATCGSKGLNATKLENLKGRRVVVFPDSGELEEWRKIMSQTEGINYSICDRLEDYPPNTDITDLIFLKSEEKETSALQIQVQDSESDAVDSLGATIIPDDMFSANTDECPF